MPTRYMVIERFHHGKEAVYQRLAASGRMMPDGLKYIDSWLTADGRCCFQLMETTDERLFAEWTRHWQDLVDFEIFELGEKPAGQYGEISNGN